MWKALSESAICLLTKLPQCGKFCKDNFHNVESFVKKTSTMWKVCQQNFQNVERVLTKPHQCGKYAKKTSTM